MMASKEQERAALAKIRKIVAELGEDSYIGTAFDGAWELAEGNIDDDAACSCKWYVDEYHRLQAERRENAARDKENEARTELLQKQVEICSAENRELSDQLKRTTADRYEEAQERIETDAHIKELELEMIRLKARLFDLIDA